MKRVALFLMLGMLAAQTLWAAGRAEIPSLARDPYVSAVVLDADSGETLFAENPDATIFPASIVKLITLQVVLDQVDQGRISLDEMVQVTNEAAKTGGSQVYLDPREQFSVEELLYALIVQSANDAAVALATHVAGSKEGFVALMNSKAAELGMKNTRLHSVHGLPPAEGQQPDETTAGDLARLSRALVGNPAVLKYTAIRERGFRDDTFMMRTHNHLLRQVDGCDGLKTGYFKAAGFSIAATAKRGGVRVIAIVAGSADRKVRDAKAMELLAKGFTLLPAKPLAAVIEPPAAQENQAAAPPPSVTAQAQPAEQPAAAASAQMGRPGWQMFLFGIAASCLVFGLLAFWLVRRGSSSKRQARGRFINRQ